MPEWVGLSSQPPDFGNALARVAQIKHIQQQGAAAQQQIDAQNRLTTLAANPDFFRRYIANDPNALAEAAGTGLPGFNMAVPRADLARQQTEFNALFGGAPPAAATPPPNQNATPASMPIGLRNNNPLNIRFAGQPGAEPGEGGFARFPTMEAGIGEAQRQLGLYASRGVNTLRGAISRWAPPSENDTDAYVTRVAQATGIDPDAPINLADPAVTQRILPAMAQVELGQPLPTAGAAAEGPTRGTMPGTPTPTQFAQMARLAAMGNPMAQEFIKTWAPFMRADANNLPLSPEVEAQRIRIAQASRPNTSLTVDQRGETARDKALAEADAATLRNLSASAIDARRLLTLFDRAEAAVQRVPEGAGAQLVPALGQIGKRLGFEVAGADEAEVLRSITNQLSVLQRVPGSGSTSDYEMGLYQQAVARLGNTRDGNLKLLALGRKLAERRIQEAGIFRQNLGKPEMEERLNELGPVFSPEELDYLSGPPASGPVTISGPGGQGSATPPPAAQRPPLTSFQR